MVIGMNKYPVESFTLSSGLRGLYIPKENSDSVFVSMLGRVGHRVEEEDEIGAAHFLEHLFFDGTTKRSSANKIANYLEGHGGRSNGHTRAEEVEYWAKVLADKAEIAFDYLSDIVINSLLRESDIRKEQKVIAQEAAQKKDNPDDVLFRYLLQIVYPNQGLGRTIFDEEDNLVNIDRDTLLKYRNRNYNQENFILCIAGNISKSRALNLSEKYFKAFQNGRSSKFEPAKINKNETIQVTQKDFSQSKLAIAFGGFPFGTTQSYHTGLLSIILGGGLSSRLFKRLREQLHLVYNIGSFQNTFSDSGYFTIHSKINEENLLESITEITNIIKQLIDKGVTSQELDKAKNRLLSGLLFNFEVVENYASFFQSRFLFKNEIRSVDEYVETIKSASINDLLSVAKVIFSDRPKVTILTKNNIDINLPKI
jgi:predicted Zn-dependent peptidase